MFNRKFNATLIISTLLTLAVFVMPAFSQTAHQMDTEKYIKIAEKKLNCMKKMILGMEKLIEIGIVGCKEHLSEPETPAIEKQLIQILLDNIDEMPDLALEDIENLWHDAGFLINLGIDINPWWGPEAEPKNELKNHFDSIIHPATVIILQKQGIDELEEVIEHVKALD